MTFLLNAACGDQVADDQDVLSLFAGGFNPAPEFCDIGGAGFTLRKRYSTLAVEATITVPSSRSIDDRTGFAASSAAKRQAKVGQLTALVSYG
jgi:hypothetical protein